jgi:hypothetical protein
MIGCAWLLPEEKRLFCLFPEVLHIDATACTNREDCPLLTITGRDSRGKAFTVLRVFLPNERAWVFRWLFQVVMPELLGASWVKQVTAIITDGDAQEMQQLDVAIKNFFHRPLEFITDGTLLIEAGLVTVPFEGIGLFMPKIESNIPK